MALPAPGVSRGSCWACTEVEEEAAVFQMLNEAHRERGKGNGELSPLGA